MHNPARCGNKIYLLFQHPKLRFCTHRVRFGSHKSPFRSVPIRFSPFQFPESPFRYSESPFRYPRKSVSVRSGPCRSVWVPRESVSVLSVSVSRKVRFGPFRSVSVNRDIYYLNKCVFPVPHWPVMSRL